MLGDAEEPSTDKARSDSGSIPAVTDPPGNLSDSAATNENKGRLLPASQGTEALGTSHGKCLIVWSDRQPDSPRAWIVALGGFSAGTAVMGLIYSAGVFIVPLMEDFGTELSETSLVASMPLAFFYIFGLCATQLSEHFGFHRTACFGAILWVAGWLLASWAQALWQYILCQGVLSGAGGALVYWPIVTIMPQWFKKYRATAMGISILGSGVGNIALSLGGQSAIIALGWRNTLRIIGGAGTVLIALAILLVDRRTAPHQKHASIFRAFKAIFHSIKELFRFTNARLFFLASFFFQFTFFVPYTFIAPYSNALNLPPTFGGFALAMLGVGSATGRIVFGPIADYFGRVPVFRITFFLTALIISCWPACRTEAALTAFCIFYGLASGGFAAMIAVIATELWGIERLGGFFTLVNLVAIPGAFASGPLFGAIVQGTGGSYSAAIGTATAFLWLAWLLLMFMSTKPAPSLRVLQTNASSSAPSHPGPGQIVEQASFAKFPMAEIENPACNIAKPASMEPVTVDLHYQEWIEVLKARDVDLGSVPESERGLYIRAAQLMKFGSNFPGFCDFPRVLDALMTIESDDLNDRIVAKYGSLPPEWEYERMCDKV